MGDLGIRTIEPDELQPYMSTLVRALAQSPDESRIERGRPLCEYDRSFAALDGRQIVGVTRMNSFDLSLPGGRVAACAGCTGVGVLPTHRRRGLMSELMRRALDQTHERGEPLAALYASESPIYGRFGFGPAVPAAAMTLPRRRIRVPGTEPTDVRLVDIATALETFPDIHERTRRRRHGMLSRRQPLWAVRMGHDPPAERNGRSERFLALLADRGFVAYRLDAAWSGEVPSATLHVEDLVAVDAATELELWRYLLGVDLVETIEIRRRPVDDPLPYAVDDQGRIDVRTDNPLWLRLVDVPAAFTNRVCATSDRLTLRVHDAFAPWNDDVWVLDAGPDGATCEPVDVPPDVELDVAELATIFLGGVRPTRLLDAGRIVEHQPGAAARLGALLATDRAPWNPTGI